MTNAELIALSKTDLVAASRAALDAKISAAPEWLTAGEALRSARRSATDLIVAIGHDNGASKAEIAAAVEAIRVA